MKIACVGDNCIDYYDDNGQAFPGGNPVNVAVYAKRLGAESAYTRSTLLSTQSVSGRSLPISVQSEPIVTGIFCSAVSWKRVWTSLMFSVFPVRQHSAMSHM